ncbi:MAG TPA: hypothetical protein VFW22_17760 [Pseudolabrys sp.]|nr:hypothetical protein [Pseudolabrys sp.]
MTRINPTTGRQRIAAILTAWVFVFGAAQAALAKGGNSSSHSGMQSSMKSDMKSGKSGMKSGSSDHDSKKHKDKSGDTYSEKKKHKGKDKGTTTGTDKGTGTGKGTGTATGTGTQKAPVIVNGGFVKDKLPNGTVYYRRATQAELDAASKAGSSGATTPGAGGTTGKGDSTTAGTTPPPATPPAGPLGDAGPVVRDHRPGGNAAYPAPGTIIRDHTNGKDGTPYVVVSAGPTGTVTRKATDADLVKAGLKKPEPPAATEVPIGMSGGGR